MFLENLKKPFKNYHHKDSEESSLEADVKTEQRNGVNSKVNDELEGF